MDEKGFSLGTMSKHHCIFNKTAVEKNRIIGASQLGNREWITILVTVCGDGTWLPPGIIFAGASGNLQTTWVDNVELGQHQASFASSPNSWTNDRLGLAWLQDIFDKNTKRKALQGREWRLLIVDGHGSHINMNFLNWCEEHRIHVAVYPPHTTHRLQPLDMSIFAPLATYYSQSLKGFIQQTTALSGIGKRDFFELFWPAFTKSFTPKNIASGWQKTGLFPWCPDHVLSKLPHLQSEKDADPSRPGSKSSSNSAASASMNPQAIRQLVLNVAKKQESKKIRKLQNTCSKLQNTVTLQAKRIQDLEASIQHEKKRRKRGKALFKQLRADDGYGAMFFSPAKIQQARDLQAEREAQKQAEQASKQLTKEQKNHDKALKQQEDAQKKQQRTQQRQESMAAKVLQKA